MTLLYWGLYNLRATRYKQFKCDICVPGESDRKEMLVGFINYSFGKVSVANLALPGIRQVSFQSWELSLWVRWEFTRAVRKQQELLVKPCLSTTPTHQNKWWASTTSNNTQIKTNNTAWPIRLLQPLCDPIYLFSATGDYSHLFHIFFNRGYNSFED